MASDLRFYMEDGQGKVCDESGKEAMSIDETPSFRLSKLKVLQIHIKYTKVDVSDLSESHDTEMEDIREKMDRPSEYTKYTSHQRDMYIYYAFEEALTHDDACKLASVNKHTARKWRKQYKANPDTWDSEKRPTKLKSDLFQSSTINIETT